MQKQEIFPEIFQRTLTSLDLPGLPPINDSGFEQAVIMHYAMQYAAKGWTAAVVVSDGMVRVVKSLEKFPAFAYTIAFSCAGTRL